MTYNIPFKPEVFQKQYDIYWDHITKKAKRNKDSYYGCVALMFLFFLLYHQHSFKFILLGYGLCCLVLALTYSWVLRKDEKRKLLFAQRYIANQSQGDQDIIWEFTDEHVRIKDFQSDVTHKWQAYFSHKVIDNVLFLSFTDTINYASFLGADEVGIQEFNKIVALVQSKLPTESK